MHTGQQILCILAHAAQHQLTVVPCEHAVLERMPVAGAAVASWMGVAIGVDYYLQRRMLPRYGCENRRLPGSEF